MSSVTDCFVLFVSRAAAECHAFIKANACSDLYADMVAVISLTAARKCVTPYTRNLIEFDSLHVPRPRCDLRLMRRLLSSRYS